jgi:hypothetical protein
LAFEEDIARMEFNHLQQAKISPPALPSLFLTRERCNEELASCFKKGHVFIQAASGYGKSTLAHSYLVDAQYSFLWISLSPSEKLYVMAGLTDVRGDVFRKGEFFNLGDQFQNGKFWKSAEVGFVPSFEERYFKKISITYWHSDAYTNVNDAQIESGQGIALSAHWFFKDRFIPFARFGISNGNGENAFYKADIQIGHGYRFLNYDILGFSLSWNQPNISGVKDQITSELFYRINVTAHLEFTPSVQFIANPTFNTNTSSLFYFGMRGRVTL